MSDQSASGAAGDTGSRPLHVPVLLDAVVDLLTPPCTGGAGPHPVVVDATLGLGGHSAALLERFADVRLIGLDRDGEALARAQDRLAPFADRVTLVQTVFDALPDVLARTGVRRLAGVLFDLGVSSLQLDADDRGFSYARDTRLDMRMNAGHGPSAYDVVNDYAEDELARVLREYGEERYARRVAAAIVRARTAAPIETSARLAELVRDAIPAPARRTGGNPAKRTFQALRIEVNDELGALRRALPAAITALAVGGRIVVLSYHSLEDRIVKRTLQAAATSAAPPDLPVLPEDAAPQLRLLTRGALQASAEEVATNPRAASVRLRAAERIRSAA